MNSMNCNNKIVYRFGSSDVDGHADIFELLGKKGANLSEMARMGLPVPPGFVITTGVCQTYFKNGCKLPTDLKQAAKDGVTFVEKEMGLKFGDPERPLLVSVRSGSSVSMPGMMNTVLNLGLCDRTAPGLIKLFGDERFVYDSYRRFIQMYGNVVQGLPDSSFEGILRQSRNEWGVKEDCELPAEALKKLVHLYLEQYRDVSFPQDPWQQLWDTIQAVFDSWNSPRAKAYRKLNHIPSSCGTGVTVQAMVFGNMGESCATGVCFTRDPATGEKKVFGEYLQNAQGEDVVAGIRTPQPLVKTPDNGQQSLEVKMPESFTQLCELLDRLEKAYKDMQDVEFTIQSGKLFLLQTRTGKRTAKAAVKIAVDMVDEGILSPEEALLSMDGNQISQLLYPRIHPDAEKDVLCKGLPASPGVVSGHIVFTPESAQQQASEGKKVVLVRHETSPEDIEGMAAAQGILTAHGGMTSHAAVVARGMGKCCVAGCSALEVFGDQGYCQISGTRFQEGDVISLDGLLGEVIRGKVPTIPAELDDDFETVMSWADRMRRLRVRTNADTPEDAKRARELGAEGIGLTRTEHMFFDKMRIQTFRRLILCDNEKEETEVLKQLKVAQKEDFVGIFREMAGLPVTIRLLDPPLHEFLPHCEDKEIGDLAKAMGRDVDWLKGRVRSLEEANPMLGHRGARLGVSFPEIYEMQVEAIVEAAIDVKTREHLEVFPEIMIPLTFGVEELKHLRDRLEVVVQRICAEKSAEVPYLIGTMIEIPRAALVADKLAGVADFFSFGTNDLTQLTYGISRDDSPKFLPTYVEHHLVPVDPFVSIDEDGVGALMTTCLEKARTVKHRHLHYGLCGEHGGEAKSVAFCHKIGLDYVSCSPFRLPVARLAAAQAALLDRKGMSAAK